MASTMSALAFETGQIAQLSNLQTSLMMKRASRWRPRSASNRSPFWRLSSNDVWGSYSILISLSIETPQSQPRSSPVWRTGLRSGPADQHPRCAIDADFLDIEHVTRCLALHPQPPARARMEMGKAGLPASWPGFGIHEGESISTSRLEASRATAVIRPLSSNLGEKPVSAVESFGRGWPRCGLGDIVLLACCK